METAYFSAFNFVSEKLIFTRSEEGFVEVITDYAYDCDYEFDVQSDDQSASGRIAGDLRIIMCYSSRLFKHERPKKAPQ